MEHAPLPCDLFTAAEVRRLDRCAIDEHGIAGGELIHRAGAAAFAFAGEYFGSVQRVVVICGGGNNGADGCVFAQFAHQAGWTVQVFLLDETRPRKGDAAVALAKMREAGVCTMPYSRADLNCADLIVDAMFGTGLDRSLQGIYGEIVADIANSGIPVLAMDIPSGLNADSGAMMGATVKAAATVTFVALKRGMFTAAGRDCCGTIVFSGLDIPSFVFSGFRASARRLTPTCVAPLLEPRALNSHKGRYGHVLVMGGNRGMSGAVQMAAEAALRVGAGLVSIATRAKHAGLISAARPELMCHGVDTAAHVDRIMAQASVIAVGPGLGQDPWGRLIFDCALKSTLPMIVDADALNWLAEMPQRRDNWVLTPHPGEAARLLGCSTAEVQNDRFAACVEIHNKYGGVCVLKGAGTLVFDGNAFGVCDAGNPRMATAGMGDTLTGIMAGLAAQALIAGRSLTEIASAAVLLHARAADAASENGKVGLIATDIFPWLRRWASDV